MTDYEHSRAVRAVVDEVLAIVDTMIASVDFAPAEKEAVLELIRAELRFRLAEGMP